MSPARSWPAWWDWDLELTSHLLKRMVDRGFNEVALRAMLDAATEFREDLVEDRWVIEVRHRKRSWEVIVEPDVELKLLVVITAYPADEV
ncbi:MAG: hypothetical protein GXP62_16520 [Oligoflexia bacterium]|nr:hypothetical protein [Oligoflexia bacterium]